MPIMEPVKKVPPKPRLTNRGPAGLLTKIKRPEGETAKVVENAVPEGKINSIAPSLKGLVMPIKGLKPDPDNARLHPERNMEAIKASLSTYGQVKPIVVRKKGMVVLAGNGTLQAAIALGWDKIAVSVVDMTEGEAAGFGIADNRTAELAKWDLEVVARLDKLIMESGLPMIGWSLDEMEVLRAADWTPPVIDDSQSDGGGGGASPLVISLTPEEREVLDRALVLLKTNRTSASDLSDGACIAIIANDWVDAEPEAKPAPTNPLPSPPARPTPKPKPRSK
jgi:hypothetical protein